MPIICNLGLFMVVSETHGLDQFLSWSAAIEIFLFIEILSRDVCIYLDTLNYICIVIVDSCESLARFLTIIIFFLNSDFLINHAHVLPFALSHCSIWMELGGGTSVGGGGGLPEAATPSAR